MSTLALKTMRATSGLKFERYGALISLLYDKRKVCLFVERISVCEIIHHSFPCIICYVTNILVTQRKIVHITQLMDTVCPVPFGLVLLDKAASFQFHIE